MLYLTSREFLAKQTTIKAFHATREREIRAWLEVNDPVYRAIRSVTHVVTHVVPGMSNPYDD